MARDCPIHFWLRRGAQQTLEKGARVSEPQASLRAPQRL
jgi:hypothetical protein